MASLLEHVSLNKLTNQLGQAIEDVGGNISTVESPYDYPNIIRQQLSAGVGSNIVEGNGVSIKKDGANYIISANTGAILIEDINPPHNTDEDANVDVIPAGTTIQQALEIIINDVLPTLPSLLKGDFIKSSIDGTDEYQNPNYPTLGHKSGLDPDTMYLRLFVASRKEPIYVSCKPLGNIGNPSDYPVYEGSTSNTVEVVVEDGKIKAELISVGNVVINKENISEELLNELSKPTLDEGEAEEIFSGIFG